MHEKDAGAWEVFSDRYRVYIQKLLYRLNIHNDQDDITQDVMLAIWNKLNTYDREQSKFRTWLASVVRFTAINHINKSNRRNKLIKPQNSDMLESIPDETSFLYSSEEDWKVFITKKALERIKKEFRGQAIQVFELSLNGESAQSISEQLQLTVSTVYTLKKRVKKRLMQEVYFLQKDMDDHA